MWRKQSTGRSRRCNLFIVVLLCIATGSALPAIGAERSTVEHPFRKLQNFTEHKRCDNCGMDLNKWARTRHEFRTATGSFHTCSLTCCVILSWKRKEEGRSFRVAEYLRPEKMVDADKAVYVMGSSAPGTMTALSKIAFGDKKEAVAFARRYGGGIVKLKDALDATRKEALRRM
jgi:nitrous oxide reductase accessory protein NosL